MTVYLISNLQFTRQQQMITRSIIPCVTQPVNRIGPALHPYLAIDRMIPTMRAKSASVMAVPEGRHRP